MMNRKPLVGILVIILSLQCAASRAIQTQSAAPAPKATIPFDLVNRHIILKVKVNDSRPLSFVLDTGDDFGIIDLDRAKELGLNLRGQVKTFGAGAGSQTGAFVQDSTFSIPGLDGFSQRIKLALPVGTMSSRLGQDFDGIIGSEFISEFVVEIDYQSRLLKLYDKSTFSYSGSGESIPIELNSAGHPIIEAEVTPTASTPSKGKFVLDIGSGAALALYSPFVAEKKLISQQTKTIKAMGAGAGGEIVGRIGRVSELKIGKYRISNPITMFSEDKAGAFASSSLLGNIGAQIMNRFKLLLDYGHKRIIFEPNSDFEKPFDRAFDGLGIQAEGKDYRVFRIREVIPDTPAIEAGLQKDDIITAVDGRPATEFTLSQLHEMFEKPVPYKLTVRRGEQTLQVTLTPKRLV